MRELVHFKVIHDISEIFRSELETEEEEKDIDNFNSALKAAYENLGEYVLKLHKNRPFKRVYVDGYAGINPKGVTESSSAIHYPCRLLIQQGAELMQTEHIFVDDLIESMFEELLDDPLNLSKVPVKVLEDKLITVCGSVFPKSFDGKKFVTQYRDFFKGLKTADIHAARENWIGHYIDESLREGERGILFLGKTHKEERIKRKLGKNTTYIICNFL